MTHRIATSISLAGITSPKPIVVVAAVSAENAEASANVVSWLWTLDVLLSAVSVVMRRP